jgi:hypothetical protein
MRHAYTKPIAWQQSLYFLPFMAVVKIFVGQNLTQFEKSVISSTISIETCQAALRYTASCPGSILHLVGEPVESTCHHSPVTI